MSWYQAKAGRTSCSSPAPTRRASRFLKEARRQQITADLVGGDGWQTLATDPLAEGIYVGAPFSAQDPRPEVQAFVTAYKTKYNGEIPNGNAALAYDATKLLAHAVDKVGPDRIKIRDYLANSRREPYRRRHRRRSASAPTATRSASAWSMTRVRDQGALPVETNQ